MALPAELAFSPDGRWIATKRGSDVCVLDRTTGQLIRTFPHIDLTYRLEFSPDSRRLVVLGVGGLIAWDIPSGTEHAALPSELGQGTVLVSVGQTPGGPLLASGMSAAKPAVWDAGRHALQWKDESVDGAAVLSRDGRLLATYPAMAAYRPRGLHEAQLGSTCVFPGGGPERFATMRR